MRQNISRRKSFSQALIQETGNLQNALWTSWLSLRRQPGAEVAGRLIQAREAAHPATYIGKGKIEELKDLIWETDATGIICDDELTSVQLGNLEAELSCKIIDRTLLILDIFAARAVSGEGKIQVELAQLRYRGIPSDGTGKIPLPPGQEVSVREGPVRRSWRWIDG